MTPLVRHIDEVLAGRPKDEAGRPLCPCGAPVGPRAIFCGRCSEEAGRTASRAEIAAARARGIAAGLEALPRGFDWTDDAAIFSSRVPSSALRGFAEAWSPADGSVLLLGPTGSGKTAAMLRAGRRAIRAGVPAAFASGLALGRSVQRHPLGRGAPPDLLAAQGAPLLLLDEIGGEGGDPTWLLEVVEERYSRGRITVSTSGLSLRALEERYGVAAVRRLVEPGGTILEAAEGA